MWLCLHTCFPSHSTCGSTNSSPDAASVARSCGIGKQILCWSGSSKNHLDFFSQTAQPGEQQHPNLTLEKGNGTDSINPCGKRRFRLSLKLSHRSLDLLPAPSCSPGKGGTGVEKELWPHNQPIPHLQSRRRVLNCPSSFFVWKSSSDFPLRGSAVTKSIRNSRLQIYFSMTFSSHSWELSVQEPGGLTRQPVNPVKHNPFTSKESVSIILANSAALASRNFRKRKGSSKFVDNSRKPFCDVIFWQHSNCCGEK